MAKQTWRGLWSLLTPMSHEDYSTHCAMASRANKGVVLKATDSHRVLRDHLRKDQLSVTRPTAHRSHPPAKRPPIIASIEHFHRQPEVTRYGDEIVFDLVRRGPDNQGPTPVPITREVVLPYGSGGQEQLHPHPAPLTHAWCVAPSAWARADYQSHDHL